MLTRGPLSGRHMSPWHWFKIYVVGRIQPRDLQERVILWEGSPNRCAHKCFLLYICETIYLNCNSCCMGRGPGRGLAPTPGYLTIALFV
jgi:hypothetical protein